MGQEEVQKFIKDNNLKSQIHSHISTDIDNDYQKGKENPFKEEQEIDYKKFELLTRLL